MSRLNFILFACLSLAIYQAFAEELPEESLSTAKEINETIYDQLGTAEKINNNAITPLTSSAKMKTFDGTKEFSANFMCRSEASFADFTIVPLGNGNLRIMNIRQDTDQDGTIDSYQTPNWQASAICANGFLMCSDPANPTSCNSYKWVAGDNMLLSAQQTALTQLGGCYCINNACGQSLLMNNLQSVMQDLGSGMAATLTAKDPYYALTGIDIDGTRAELKGTSTSNCNPASADTVLGEENISAITDADYRNNPGKLTQDGFAVQGESPLANIVGNNGSDTGFTNRSCAINRIVQEDKVTLEDIVAFDSGVGSLYEISENKLRLVLGTIGDNYWSGNCSYYSLETAFYVYKPERVVKATLSRAKYDDWMQVHINQDGNWNHVWNGPHGTWTNPSGNVPGRCELEQSWDQPLSVNFTNLFTTPGQKRFRVRVEVSGSGEGYLLGEIELDTQCKMKPDEIVDSCQVYETNDKCTLVEEKVNGVTTFSNGFSTGLVPLPESVGMFCGNDEKRDWSRKERTYRCESDSDYNFDEAFERISYVKENSTDELWKDRVNNSNGEPVYGSGTFTNYNGLGALACTNTCKTRKAAVLNDVVTDGVVGDKHNDTSTFDYFYYQCTGSDRNQCPAGTGEEIVKNCQCLNEFAESTAIMQALRLAGQDMICTNGEEKMPDGSDVK